MRFRRFKSKAERDKMMADLLGTLTPTTRLCVAADITLPTEFIQTRFAKDWKNGRPDLHKRPAIFIIQK